jgi:hypothetical protein
MKLRRPFGLLTFVAAASLWTLNAGAQEIISYSDLSNGADGTRGATMVLPGAPMPVQAAASSSNEAEAERPTGADAGASYEIAIHGQGPAGASTAQVQSREWPDLYRGIVPGRRDALPHLEKAQVQGRNSAQPNQLTWIGFLPEETRTRVFFQGARAPQYEMQRSQDGKTLTITFRNAKLPQRNFSRFIDTSYFNRNVMRIESKAQRGDVVIQVSLREEAFPTVNREGDYLFFDFTHTPASSVAQTAN